MRGSVLAFLALSLAGGGKQLGRRAACLSFIPLHEEQRQAELCELRASLVNRLSSRPIRAEKTLSQAKKHNREKEEMKTFV